MRAWPRLWTGLWAALALAAPERQNGPVKRAPFSPELIAQVVSRRALHYRAGGDPALDRPAHVRAASGVAWIGDRLATIQDDAHFVALVEPASGLAEASPLPAGADGRRLFDDTRGTKHLKLDLEACFALRGPAATRLVALGSGTKPQRERIVVLTFDPGESALTDLRTIDARTLYASLHATPELSGGELNIEGAVLADDALLLFQRGNGALRDGQAPPNAVATVPLAGFERYLAASGAADVPALARVDRYDLGEIEGVRFTFTDATASPWGTLFLASAEASSNSVDDGLVYGTRIGVIDRDGRARTGSLLAEDGRPGRFKAEGIALDPRDPRRAWVVIDMDDPARPSELLELRISIDEPG